jgi:hypothetical protein
MKRAILAALRTPAFSGMQALPFRIGAPSVAISSIPSFFGAFFRRGQAFPFAYPSCMFDAPATGGHAVNDEFSPAAHSSRDKIL